VSFVYEANIPLTVTRVLVLLKRHFPHSEIALRSFLRRGAVNAESVCLNTMEIKTLKLSSRRSLQKHD